MGGIKRLRKGVEGRGRVKGEGGSHNGISEGVGRDKRRKAISCSPIKACDGRHFCASWQLIRLDLRLIKSQVLKRRISSGLRNAWASGAFFGWSASEKTK